MGCSGIFCLLYVRIIQILRAQVWPDRRRVSMGTANAKLNQPGMFAARLHAGNLIHLKEISRASDSMSGHSLLNLIGNVGIFVPLGIFLGVLAKSGKLTWAGSFWSSLGVSLVLDYTQDLFSIGTFDVDDLILNSTGGSIGFVVYALCARLTTAASSVPNGKPAR